MTIKDSHTHLSDNNENLLYTSENDSSACLITAKVTLNKYDQQFYKIIVIH